MRVLLLSSILISFLLSCGPSRPSFEGSRCFVTLETDSNIRCSYHENFSIGKIPDTIHLLYTYCLDGNSFLYVDSLSKYGDYVRTCLRGESIGKSVSLLDTFYREVVRARDRGDVLRLSDILERKFYCHRFRFYYPEKVNFYRNILRFETAYFHYRRGNINSALRILYSLEKSKDVRVVWIARRLKNRIYEHLNQPADTSSVPFPMEGDTLLIYIPRCEMDFPETLIVRGGRLHLWISPFSRRFLGDSLFLNEIQEP